MSPRARFRLPSVRVRVAALSGVMVIGFSIIGTVLYLGRMEVEHALRSQQTYSLLAAEANRFRTLADDLKVTAYEWTGSRLAHHGEAFKERHRGLVAQLVRMETAEGAVIVSKEVSDLKHQASALAEQAMSLDALYADIGYQSESGLRGKLAAAGAELEKLARPLSSGGEGGMRVWAATLGLLGQEARARIVLDDNVLGAFEVDSGRLTRAIGRLDGDNAEAGPALSAAGEGYQAAFEAWTETERRVSGQGEKVTGQFELLVPVLDGLIERVSAEERKANGQLVASQESTGRIILGAMGFTLALGLMLTILVGRSISVPLVRLQQSMRRLADGDTATDIPSVDATDEIGEMARTVLVFRDSALERERLTTERERQAAAEIERANAISDEISSFDGSVKRILAEVGSAIGELATASAQLEQSADRVSEQARTAGEASGRASQNISSVASAADELDASLHGVADQTGASSAASERAVAEVRGASDSMSTLSAATSQIGEVAGLIRSIAAQTNLLALNATIEAARAGDAGKGFAVVASEVKALANQTTKATEDIARQIDSVQSASRNTLGALGLVQTSVEDLARIVATVSSSVGQQTAAVSEIARSAAQVSSEAKVSASAIDSVESVASQSLASARSVADLSVALGENAERLGHEIGRFLDRVRDA